jgi:primosomal protein N' (replication factor Y)
MFVQVALNLPFCQLFDYAVPHGQSVPPIGARVLVPFGARSLVGFVLGVSPTCDYAPDKVKPITQILDTEAVFDASAMAFYQWVAHFYAAPLGEVLTLAMPSALRKAKPLVPMREKKSEPQPMALTPPLPLNPQQAEALAALSQAQPAFQVSLLEGVTGSGKTEVYLQRMAQTLADGGQVLVLIPEIALTRQMIGRFEARFSPQAYPMVVMHSSLSEGARLNAWLKARSGEAKIILGTRSAVFTPLKNPGLCILDEEHDASFKAQDGLRYNARDLLLVRAKQLNIPVLLGSATPSLESLHNAQSGKFQHLKLTQRATQAPLPKIKLIDTRSKNHSHGLSADVLTAMKKHLGAGQQVMLFINRRGFAPVMLCEACGWVAECQRCDKPMTLHKAQHKLKCHHCDQEARMPSVCPACGNQDLLDIGQGTQKLEERLVALFPDEVVLRIDRDSTARKGTLEAALAQAESAEASILIGTQMLAKGHHFPKVTLVAILDVDQALFSLDFRAMERLAQLITQVAGRSGRESDRGEVLIQTAHPEHALFETLLKSGYGAAARQLLFERQQTHLPPFAHQLLVRAQAHKRELLQETLNDLKTQLVAWSQEKGLTISLLGPAPAPMERKANQYRWQLIFQAKTRQPLVQLAHWTRHLAAENPRFNRMRWSLDLDPYDFE